MDQQNEMDHLIIRVEELRLVAWALSNGWDVSPWKDLDLNKKGWRWRLVDDFLWRQWLDGLSSEDQWIKDGLMCDVEVENWSEGPRLPDRFRDLLLEWMPKIPSWHNLEE